MNAATSGPTKAGMNKNGEKRKVEGGYHPRMKHQTYVRYLHAHFSTQKGQIPLWPHRYFKQGGTSKYYEPTKRAQVVLYKEPK